MDKPEYPRVRVHLGHYSRVPHAALARTSLEKHQVALLQLRSVFYVASQTVLWNGTSRKGKTKFHVHIAGKSCTVKHFWSLAAIVVGFAKVSTRLFYQQVCRVGTHLLGHHYVLWHLCSRSHVPAAWLIVYHRQWRGGRLGLAMCYAATQQQQYRYGTSSAFHISCFLGDAILGW